MGRWAAGGALAVWVIVGGGCLSAPSARSDASVPPGCEVVIDDSFDDEAFSTQIWTLYTETAQSTAEIGAGVVRLMTTDDGYAEIAAREDQTLDSAVVEVELETMTEGDGETGVLFETASAEILGFTTYGGELYALRGVRPDEESLCDGPCVGLLPGVWHLRFAGEGGSVRFDVRAPDMDWRSVAAAPGLDVPATLRAWSFSPAPGAVGAVDVHRIRRLLCTE